MEDTPFGEKQWVWWYCTILIRSYTSLLTSIMNRIALTCTGLVFSKKKGKSFIA